MTHRIHEPFLLAVAWLLALAVTANQPLLAFDYFWTAGTGDWNSTANWDQGFVPNAEFEEVGVINNAGTATLSAAATDAAGLRLGDAIGDSGTLQVLSGGSINFVDSTGEPQGIANIGLAGTGVLEVQGGGTLGAVSLDQNVGSNLIIGGGAGAASVSSTSTSWLGGTTTVHGPGHTFTVGASVFLEGSGTFNPVISADTHTVLRATGTASLGGTLQVDFAPGYMPALGDAWDLVDANVVTGNFANAPGGIVQVTGEHAPETGSAYRLRTVDGGTNGSVLQMSLEGLLVLRVNRDTGAMNIVNPMGASVSALAGYSVTSGVGSLLASYKGISGTPAGDTGWEKAPMNSTTGLAEFKPTGSLNVSSTSTNLNLGTGFSKTAVASQGLGVNGEDLVFNYHSVGGEVLSGQVEYIGTQFLNNLVLTVDPTTGVASIKNDTLGSIAIDGYSILSSTGALSTSWTGLGGSWNKSPASSSSALTETNPNAPTPLGIGQSLSLGDIGTFATEAAQDGLSMKFLIGSESAFRFATIVFASATSQPGDFDGDGDVDGRDFLTWQRNPAVGALADWQNNYGAGSLTAAASAVPEPSTLGLTLMGATALLTRRRRHSLTVEMRKENRTMNRLRTLNSTRFTGVVAAGLCLAMLHVSAASAQILGLNFAASDPDLATSSLVATDVAGVVPTANWNNLEGNTGTGVTGLFYDNAGTAVASTVTLDWNSPNTWRSGGNNAFPAGPDQRLLSGYLDTGDTAATGITITLSNIDAALRTNFYDVYVYFVSDSGEDRGGGYTVNDGVTSYLKYGSTQASPSAFVQDPGSDINNSQDGNYLRYRGLSGASLTITSDTTLTTPNGFRAPINAVEIVATIVGPGDANEDGDVDIDDYNLINNNMETAVAFYTNGDVDGSGYVDLNDFALWRDVAPLSALVAAGFAVPEPSTATLAGVILFGLFGMRRSSRRNSQAETAVTIHEAPCVGGRRMRCTLSGKALALCLCVAMLHLSTASAQILGLNFAASDPDTATSSLAPTDVAGVIPTANWNNLTGNTGTGVTGLFYDNAGTAVASTVTLDWNSPNTWRSGGNSAFPAGPDRNLLSGYLDTGNTAANGISITLSNIDAALRAPAYDVYVYFVSDSGANRGGGYTVDDGVTSILKYGSTQASPSVYSEDPGGDIDNSLDGNYLRFRGLTGSSLTITSDTTLTSPNGFRAPINAVEIVAISDIFGPGDVNEDTLTDINDYNIIKSNFFLQAGATRGQGDLTGDGRVLLDDFALWRNNAEPGALAALGIPEPGSLVLIAAAGLMGCLRRGCRSSKQ